MTDIIQRAKDLIEEATPGPWVASDSGYIGSTSGVMIHDGQVLGDTTEDTNLIAAAPELAQALAEETWEYSYQIKYADGWETACNDVTEIDEWWPDRSDAETAANSAYDPYLDLPIRLICRRVSPLEVINK